MKVQWRDKKPSESFLDDPWADLLPYGDASELQLIIAFFLHTLKRNNWGRRKTALDLDISYQTVKLRIKWLKEKGFYVGESERLTRQEMPNQTSNK